MGAPKVIVQERDYSDYIPSNSLFYEFEAGICIPLKKGNVDEPLLITSKKEFLTKCTPYGTIEADFDRSHYSALRFLEYGNKLWVQRVKTSGMLFAGQKIERDSSANPNAVYGAGVADPAASYTFGADECITLFAKDQGVWGNTRVKTRVLTPLARETINSATAVVAATDVFTVAQRIPTGARFRFTTAGTLPPPLALNTEYFAINISATTCKFATTLANAIAGTAVDITAVGTGNMTLIPLDKVNAGTNNFVIEVYLDTNTNTPVESFVVSRVVENKDPNGNFCFIENVLKESAYISGLSNTLIVDTVLPKAHYAQLALAGGNDGAAITESDMIAAANVFSGTKYNIRGLMDGGYSGEAYKKKLDTIATARMDCVAFLSTPLTVEANSNYLNSIIDWADSTLNLNSSYSALYTPHVKDVDEFNGRDIWISPDSFACAMAAYTAHNYNLWHLIGGYKRGKVNGIDTRRRFSDGELDVLYDAGINPIRFKAGKGINIWGQKTQLKQATALDRLNVRFLLIVIEMGGKEALDNFLFEFNIAATRKRAQILVDEFMWTIKRDYGVYEFKTVCDETNNSNADINNSKMNLDLYIEPVKGVELLVFGINIMSTGAIAIALK